MLLSWVMARDFYLKMSKHLLFVVEGPGSEAEALVDASSSEDELLSTS